MICSHPVPGCEIFLKTTVFNRCYHVVLDISKKKLLPCVY
jgi:hypothetical protein